MIKFIIDFQLSIKFQSPPNRSEQPKAASITFRPQHLFLFHMRLPAATTRASHLRERMQPAGMDGGTCV